MNVGLSSEAASHISPSSVQHVNGLAVYQEGRCPSGEQGALMVSAVVAAAPREVFKVGMLLPEPYSGTGKAPGQLDS